MAEISIVVRTFNEARHLPELFDALAKQTISGSELIVVDSGSVDATREVAEEYADHVIRIDGRDFTFGYSLNVGIERARGRLIAIISAHAFPAGPQWLEQLVQPFDDEATAMVYGRQVGHSRSKFAEASDFSKTFGEDRLVLKPPDFFANNANSCVRRDLWEKHRFDEALTGLEDIDWARHWMLRGFQVVYEPSASVQHLHEETWLQVERRYHREALAAARMGLMSRKDALSVPFQELGRVVTDCLQTLWGGTARRELPGILRFRYHKGRGTVRGLLDGKVFDEPESKRALLFDRTGRAVEIVRENQAELRDVDIPPLKPSDVLVRVAYEGVCGTDLEVLSGGLGYYRDGTATYPIVPGHELSGTVVQVGPNVSNVREGDRVVVECIQGCGECDSCKQGNGIACVQRRELGVIGLNGGYAEYVRVPGRFLHIVPPGVDLVRACLCEPLAVVLKGLKRLAVLAGSSPTSCGVVGGGTIGYLAARVLEQMGHAVTVYDEDPKRQAYLVRAGVDVAGSLSDLVRREVLVEATGDVAVLDELLRNSPPGATVLLLGLPYAKQEFSFEHVVAYDKTIVGSVGSGPHDFEEALSRLSALNLDPLLERVVPLENYEEAWQLLRARAHPKIILEVNPDASSALPSLKVRGKPAISLL